MKPRVLKEKTHYKGNNGSYSMSADSARLVTEQAVKLAKVVKVPSSTFQSSQKGSPYCQVVKVVMPVKLVPAVKIVQGIVKAAKVANIGNLVKIFKPLSQVADEWKCLGITVACYTHMTEKNVKTDDGMKFVTVPLFFSDSF